MNPCQYLTRIKEAIKKREPTVEPPFTITIRNEEVCCVKGKLLDPKDPVIFLLTNLHVTQGFSAPEWEKMFSRMNAYFSRSK